MKVLFVGEDLNKSRSGVVTVMNQILNDNCLQEEFSFVKVFTTSDDYSTFKKLFSWFKAYFIFLYYLPSCDLVHIHHASDMNFWLSSVLVNISKFFGKKVLLHNHSADFHEFYNKCTERAKLRIQKVFTRASGTIVLSNHWLNWYSSIAPNAKWFLLQNAIEFPSKVSVKDFSKGEVVIIYLARIEKRKGFFDLINVMPNLVNKYPQIKLFVAGQGDIEAIQNQINHLNLQYNVKILGHVNGIERNKYLEQGHILAFPSYNEGLPMSLLEAMSYGLVPVTTPVGGIPDVVAHGENGLMVKAGNLLELELGISRLIDNPLQYSNMSTKARATIEQNFNYSNYGLKLRGIYHSILS